LIEEDDIYIN
jgi:hypothetical protein